MGRHKVEPVPYVQEEKRGRGRPKKPKGEIGKRGRPPKGEFVVKPFVVHNRPDTKPENKEKYAMDAIKRAEKLYEKYNREFPNPLNLDAKKLCPEARSTWEYLFSIRGYEPSDLYKNPIKALLNSEEVLIAFESYCGYIRDNNFVKAFTRPNGEPGVLPIVPNMTNFARWLGISTRPIRTVMDKDPAAKEEYKKILSDLLSEGAMVGIYTSTSAIFTLKNLCDWADNPEDRGSKKEKSFVPVEEAEKALRELGYTRPKLLE